MSCPICLENIINYKCNTCIDGGFCHTCMTKSIKNNDEFDFECPCCRTKNEEWFEQCCKCYGLNREIQEKCVCCGEFMILIPCNHCCPHYFCQTHCYDVKSITVIDNINNYSECYTLSCDNSQCKMINSLDYKKDTCTFKTKYSNNVIFRLKDIFETTSLPIHDYKFYLNLCKYPKLNDLWEFIGTFEEFEFWKI